MRDQADSLDELIVIVMSAFTSNGIVVIGTRVLMDECDRIPVLVLLGVAILTMFVIEWCIWTVMEIAYLI